MNNPDVKDMNSGAIFAEPRMMDWSEGWGEEWEAYEVLPDYDCSDYPGGCDYKGPTTTLGDCPECGNHADDWEGPMMYYFYPLPGFQGEEEEAGKIADLPLCLIYLRVTDEWGLALSGGGMNMSWYICAAYMRLGYLPPVYFCNLPELAGKPLDATAAWILEGVEESVKCLEAQAVAMRHHVELLRAVMSG